MSIENERAERRKLAASRLNFFLTATIGRDARADFVARVRNLSAGGMMIETAESVDPGEAVRVQVRGIGLIEGRVVWARAGRAGIAFSAEVDPELARKPAPSITHEVPAHARPIIVTERKLTAAARVAPQGRLD